jgi:phage terminase large subunit
MAKQLPTLDISNEVLNEAFIPFISRKEETCKPIVVHEGGRASGKSDAIAQFLNTLSYSTKKRILLMRKVEKSIRNSSYRLIHDYVNKWKLGDFFQFIPSMLTIKVLNGSEFICMGFDEAEKIKSIANIDVVWIEEATEISSEDFETLLFTIRGQGIKRIILSFNRKLGNWTEEYFFYANGQFKERSDVYHLHTTFQDNKFLSVADIQRFERLKLSDPKKYDKIALGLPVKLEGLVYEKWDVFKGEFPVCREELYGLDFGYTDPKALIRCGRIGKDLYLDETLYERQLTREDFIKLLPSLIENRGTEIWADSEDPESKQVIFNAGWNIHAVEKTKGSVLFGVEALQAFNIHITERSTNVIKDFENYKWKQKRDGSIVPEEPAHDFSHSPRAAEYGVRSRWANLNPLLTSSDAKDTEVEEMEAITVAEGY